MSTNDTGSGPDNNSRSSSSGEEEEDGKKVEIIVSVSLRQKNKTHVVGQTSVSVDRDTLANSPVNVKMNLTGRENSNNE